jgi:glycerol-3-phosphate acyltransferase PlsX
MTSPTPITLAVDCMGGDHGPRVTLGACRRFLSTHPDARLLLVGRAEALAGFADPRAVVVAATEVVEMDDSLEIALRKTPLCALPSSKCVMAKLRRPFQQAIRVP